MNKIKALFVVPYMALAMGLGTVSLVMLAVGGVRFGWLGVALTSWPMLIFLGGTIMSLFKGASVRVPVCVGLGIAGLALALYGLFAGGEPALPAFLAAAGFAGYWLYEFWYARFGRAPAPALQPGQPLPDFTLERDDGTPVSSRSFVGQPAIFLFYRGNWCPLCMAQIREIAGLYQQLADRGAQIVLISPQSHAHTQKLAARFDVPFHFLADPGNRAAVELGIAHQGGLPTAMTALGYDTDTVMPTVVITDATGTILFADETDDYRVRPEPETFLRVLDGTLASA